MSSETPKTNAKTATAQTTFQNNAPRRPEKTKSMRPQEDDIKLMLVKAKTMLGEVDAQSEIMTNHERREYPTFDAKEIEIGKILGVGGFGIVSQIDAFHILDVTNQPENSDTEIIASHATTEHAQISIVVDDYIMHNDHEHDDQHYDVETAKHKMARRCQRSGQARYAIKHLDPRLPEKERTRGMIDMALEVKYLTVLWHPNIVKMRGICSGDLMRPDAFFIMDRLYETLDVRLESWRKQKKSHSGVLGFGKDKAALLHIRVERLIVAYDLAIAFAYMHENKLVYRDTKQENFGFDIRGDIKVFDFGLAKALLPSLKVKRSNMYNLTPITGSLPYMPPEVAKRDPYNESCDCFSFSFLFYELLALKNTPYHKYRPFEYFDRVVKGNERPTIHRSWPKLSSKLLKDAWNPDPHKRPPMKNIAKMIREDLIDLSEEESVINRTRHMIERSTRSFTMEEPRSTRSVTIREEPQSTYSL